MIFNERNGILNNLLEGQGIAGIHWLSDPTWAKPPSSRSTSGWACPSC